MENKLQNISQENWRLHEKLSKPPDTNNDNDKFKAKLKDEQKKLSEISKQNTCLQDQISKNKQCIAEQRNERQKLRDEIEN